MNKTYSVEWAERKTTSTGKAVLNCSLKDETGVVIEKVSIWADFPDFANIMTGHKVKGVLYTNAKGYKTLYPPKPENASNSPTMRSGGGIKAAQERKEASIDKFQDKKEESIRTSSSMNKAIEIAIAQLGQEDDETYERKIKYWRKWVWDNWDYDVTENPPF